MSSSKGILMIMTRFGLFIKRHFGAPCSLKEKEPSGRFFVHPIDPRKEIAMKRMTYVAVPALLVLLVFSLGGSAVWGDTVEPPDDLIVGPIKPPVGPFLPKDPCTFALLTLQLDRTNITSSEYLSDGDSFMRTYTYALLAEGETVGYLKVDYNRMQVSTEGDDRNFITAEDTFYFTDSMVLFGKRFFDGPVAGSAYRGGGVIQNIMTTGHEVLNLNLKYVFDYEDEEVCFFTY